MKYIALIIFGFSTIVHLYASLIKNMNIRNYTKPLILLSLIIYYYFSSDKISIIVLLALLFSWFGDILLMLKNDKWFIRGGIFFMISHFLYIIAYIEYIVFIKVGIIYILLCILFYSLLVFYIFSRLKIHLNKKMYYLMLLYLFVNASMNCFAIFRYISNSNIASVITVIGAMLFFVSDTILFFVKFDRNCKIDNNFLIMLTYALGQLFIVLGFIL